MLADGSCLHCGRSLCARPTGNDTTSNYTNQADENVSFACVPPGPIVLPVFRVISPRNAPKRQEKLTWSSFFWLAAILRRPDALAGMAGSRDAWRHCARDQWRLVSVLLLAGRHNSTVCSKVFSLQTDCFEWCVMMGRNAESPKLFFKSFANCACQVQCK